MSVLHHGSRGLVIIATSVLDVTTGTEVPAGFSLLTRLKQPRLAVFRRQ